ncbi:MAG: hypothetical protein QY307_02760 [Acidimicrobiia bacterium]|nr:MAG: hypothetical protein QY307_02760 [Acidimicrobiia bacterium]
MRLSILVGAGVLLLTTLVGACSEDPRQSGEYRDLDAQRIELERGVADLEAQLAQLQASLAAALSDAAVSSADEVDDEQGALVEAKTVLADEMALLRRDITQADGAASRARGLIEIHRSRLRLVADLRAQLESGDFR